MSTVMRRSPIGRPPGARATALALAGLLAGGVQTTQAANADAKANGAETQGGPGGAAGAGHHRGHGRRRRARRGPDDARGRAQGRPDRRRSLGRLAAVRLLGDAREAAAAAAVPARPGQRADARGQELRAPARGPFLRGVRDLPQPEPGAATARGQEAPRLPRPGEGRGARGAVAQERDPAGRAGEDPEPRPRDGQGDAHDSRPGGHSRRDR